MSAARAAVRNAPAPGQYWRMRIGKGRYLVGKVRAVKGDTITLVRVNEDSGDEFGKIDELHLMMGSTADLVVQLELDNYYGMLVPFGTTKKHRANGNAK